MFKTTITQKGQLTIPKPIREKLRLSPNLRVNIFYTEAGLQIKPAPTILDLAGSFKPKKIRKATALREEMKKSYGRR